MSSLHILGLILASLANRANDPVNKELHAFQGQWEIEWAETEGKKVEWGGIKVTIRGKKVLINKEEHGTLKIDPSCNPKLLDFLGSSSGIQGSTMEGIYKFEGDAMIWCLNIGEGVKNRPLEFRTDQETKCLLIKFRRLALADEGDN